MIPVCLQLTKNLLAVGTEVTIKDPRKRGKIVSTRYLRPINVIVVQTDDGMIYIRERSEIVGYGNIPHTEF